MPVGIIISCLLLVLLVKFVRAGLFALGVGGCALLVVLAMGLYTARQDPARASGRQPIRDTCFPNSRPVSQLGKVAIPPAPRAPRLPPQPHELKLISSEASIERSGDLVSIEPLEARPLSIIEIVHNEQGNEVGRRQLHEFPDWIQSGEATVRGTRTSQVLQSQRFATAEEARKQLFRQLKKSVLSDLQHHHPGIKGWSPRLVEIEHSGIILKECDVIWPLHVGQFEEQMHQVYWQVQFTDLTRNQLAAAWKPHLIRARLEILAGVFSGATMLMAVCAFFFRRPAPQAG